MPTLQSQRPPGLGGKSEQLSMVATAATLLKVEWVEVQTCRLNLDLSLELYTLYSGHYL